MGYVLLWLASWVVLGIWIYKALPRPDGKPGDSLTYGIGGGFIASLLLFLVVAVIWPFKSDGQKAADEAKKAAQAVEDACHDNWHSCKDNEMLVNKSSIYASAVVACKDAADQQARYGHPDMPFLAFGHFYGGDSYIKSGVMILREPEASFQNGFGVMARSTVTCWYDMNKQAVVDIQVEQR